MASSSKKPTIATPISVNSFPKPQFKQPTTPTPKRDSKPPHPTLGFDRFKSAFALPDTSKTHSSSPSSSSIPSFRTPGLPFSLTRTESPSRNPTTPRKRTPSLHALNNITPGYGTASPSTPSWKPFTSDQALSNPFVSPSVPPLKKQKQFKHFLPPPETAFATPPAAPTPSETKVKELSIPPEFAPSWLQKDEPVQNELTRGVNISPEKGERRKFTRNGLAERASHLMNRADTSFSLWKRDFSKRRVHGAPSLSASEAQLSTQSSTQFPKPDLKLTIKKIIWKIPVIPPSRRIIFFRKRGNSISNSNLSEKRDTDSTHQPLLSMLAICCVSSSSGLSSDDTVRVVFRFVGDLTVENASLSPLKLSCSDGFEVGKEICVWKPFVRIPMVASMSPSEDDNGHEQPATVEGGATLFCTRFAVL